MHSMVKDQRRYKGIYNPIRYLLNLNMYIRYWGVGWGYDVQNLNVSFQDIQVPGHIIEIF